MYRRSLKEIIHIVNFSSQSYMNSEYNISKKNFRVPVYTKNYKFVRFSISTVCVHRLGVTLAHTLEPGGSLVHTAAKRGRGRRVNAENRSVMFFF